MEQRGFVFNGVLVPIFVCDRGEGLPWHAHPPGISHGHYVLKGSTQVNVEGEPSKIYTVASGYIQLPADKHHSITALENGTIFINPEKTRGEPAGDGRPYSIGTCAPPPATTLYRDIPTV